jgi:hypothetical protein
MCRLFLHLQHPRAYVDYDCLATYGRQRNQVVVRVQAQACIGGWPEFVVVVEQKFRVYDYHSSIQDLL